MPAVERDPVPPCPSRRPQWNAGGPARRRPGGTLPREPPRRPSAVPPATDSLTQMPWALRRLEPSSAWPLSRGAGVTVAVIDSGVSATHPLLKGQVLEGRDFNGLPAQPGPVRRGRARHADRRHHRGPGGHWRPLQRHRPGRPHPADPGSAAAQRGQQPATPRADRRGHRLGGRAGRRRDQPVPDHDSPPRTDGGRRARAGQRGGAGRRRRQPVGGFSRTCRVTRPRTPG